MTSAPDFTTVQQASTGVDLACTKRTWCSRMLSSTSGTSARRVRFSSARYRMLGSCSHMAVCVLVSADLGVSASLCHDGLSVCTAVVGHSRFKRNTDHCTQAQLARPMQQRSMYARACGKDAAHSRIIP